MWRNQLISWLCGGVIAALLISSPALARFEDGVAAYKKGDYQAAIAAWEPLAEGDNASALFNLAQMYRRGLGVEADATRAEQYYRRAALLGHVSAQANLGSLYYTKTPPQSKEAIYFWKLAARQGDAASQYQLGVRYFNGDHVVRDQVLAYAWMILAADSGLPDARQALQTMRTYLSAAQQEQGAALAISMGKDVGRDSRTPERNVVSVPLTPVTGSSTPEAAPTPDAAEKAPVAPPVQPVPPAEPVQEVVQQAVEPVVESERATETPPVAPVAARPAPPDPPAPAPQEPAEEVAIAVLVEEAPPVEAPPPAVQEEPRPAPPVPSGASIPRDITVADNWRVQVAARRSRESAEEAVAKVSRSHGDLLSAAEIFIYRADLGSKGIFYRVQVGRFGERGDAERLCRQLKGAGTDCFVTSTPSGQSS